MGRLRNSRIGRGWRALSEDETAAASSGVNTARSRLLAFSLGAMVAGIAGVLFASIFSYVDPDVSDFRISAMTLAMVVIGGAGSVPGAIIGALLVAGYDQLLIPLLGAQLAQSQQSPNSLLASIFDVRALSFLSFGLALYLTVLLRARGRAPRQERPTPLRRLLRPRQRPSG
jgi:branched-chain amino acid transport system permease protein